MRERQLLENFQWIKEKYDYLPFPNEIIMKIISYLYEFEMNESKIPYGIEHLVIGKFMNEIYTELLPESIKKLTIDFKKKISKRTILPKHVKEVYFECYYEKTIHEDFFHSNVKSIIFEDRFSLSKIKGNLPKNLKILKNVYDEFDKIPLDIEELEFFDNIKHGHNFGIFTKLQSLDYTYTHTTYGFKVYENTFPDSIYNLKLNIDGGLKCNYLPKNLNSLYIITDSTIKIESFPDTLEKFTLVMKNMGNSSKIIFSQNIKEINLEMHSIGECVLLSIPPSAKKLYLQNSKLIDNIQLSEGMEEIYIKRLNDSFVSEISEIFDIKTIQKIFVKYESDKNKIIKEYEKYKEYIFIYDEYQIKY